MRKNTLTRDLLNLSLTSELLQVLPACFQRCLSHRAQRKGGVGLGSICLWSRGIDERKVTRRRRRRREGGGGGETTMFSYVRRIRSRILGSLCGYLVSPFCTLPLPAPTHTPLSVYSFFLCISRVLHELPVAYTYTYTHEHTHTHTHTHKHTHTYTSTHTHTNTHKFTHNGTNAPTRAHAHAHTRTYARTH